MSNFDINKFKNKDDETIFQDFTIGNVADETISYKRNRQTPINFINEDFSGLAADFFSYLYLDGVHFQHCTFGNLESENTIFDKCSFEDCNFTADIIIEHSTFREKCLLRNIGNITFRNVLFEEAIFIADIQTCSFNNSNFLICDFKTLNLIENSTFHSSVIHSPSNEPPSEFNDIIFKLTNFDLCSFENLLFNDSRIIDSSITYSNFNTVKFIRTDDLEDELSIIQISTSGDEMTLLNYSNNKFHNCDLRFIDFNHTNFEHSEFHDTQMPLLLSYCNFGNSIFDNSNFSDGQPDIENEDIFNYPELLTSSFYIVNFKDATFRNVVFKKNDMYGINFRNVQFEGTVNIEKGLIVNAIFGKNTNDKVTRNIKFNNIQFHHCLFKNEITNIHFTNCDIQKVQFINNTEFNETSYRNTNNIRLTNTIQPQNNYALTIDNIHELEDLDIEDEDNLYEEQIEAEKQRVTDVIERAINMEYTIPESESIPEQSIFPQEDDESFKIFDIIEGEIVMDENFINTFMTEYPQHKLIIKKQPNNWYPYLIDMGPISKFLADLTSENRNESSYLSNIIFICDDQNNTSKPPNDTKINEYVSHTAYLKMNFFGIQGVLIPLRDIFSLMNPQNINKKIFIIENIIHQDEIKGLLSLGYAVSYQGSVDCTNKETITVGELHYFYEWKEMLRTLTTPISNRAESTNTQINNTSDSLFFPINPDNAGNTVNIESYQADDEDTEDDEINEDHEIIAALTRLREDEPFQRNTRQRRGGKTKRKYKVHKNKKTKKNKNKKNNKK